MLKSTVRLLPFLLIVLFTSNSCKKKNDQKSKTELLTQKPWRPVKVEEKTSTTGYVDYFPGYDACAKDEKYTFFANNTMEYDPVTICDPSDPDEKKTTGPWAFTDNETKLSIGTDAYTIEQLTETTLALVYNYSALGVAYTVRITFGHI